MELQWTNSQIPDLTGKNAVVTGAKRELGKIIIKRLSDHGAHVFAVSRDEMSGDEFNKGVEPVRMIPTSMESIQRGAERIRDQVDHVDVLVHAASISVAPRFRSKEGHDLMLATNYLGFVLLTQELSSAMRKSTSPRVILAGSGEPIDIDLDLDQLDANTDLPWNLAYAQSRLAAMLFTLELNDRAQLNKSSLISAVAEARERDQIARARHPVRRYVNGIVSWANKEPADAPAAPVLFASTSDKVQGGHYYAPQRHGRLRDELLPEKFGKARWSIELRSELWQRTEDILGTRLDVA
jgi:NAD(P)-dependent dehydrogenase (short-subunit alcohol dehydrogenase family)